MNIVSKEIDVIQKIHTKIHNLDINLPAIAVVGSQSSGKSSVLESLIQKDILPRGSNLVTRCPIIIHIKKICGKEYCEISSIKYFDFSSLKYLLVRMMNEICGTDKEITHTPIVINMYLNNTLEFTLIDLPGITKIPIGSQSHDIESKILCMVREYISPTNTIILAIVNSNIDISNSESLKICKEIDPEYLRTIGVVTKIDLMDRNTNCLDVLSNKVYPLKLGFVGCINRSQEDIENGVSIQDFKKIETDFFDKSVYKVFNKNIGSTFLLEKIVSLYTTRIQECMPKIKEDIKNKLNALQKISSLDVFSIKYNYHIVLLNLITDKSVCNTFTYDDTNIVHDLRNTFKNLKISYDFSNVDKSLVNDLSIFINDDILKNVIHKNMLIIKDSVLRLQDTYKNILLSKVDKIFSKEFPTLSKMFNMRILDAIHKWNVEDKINEFIRINSNIIGNNDLFFERNVSKGLFGTYMCIKGTCKGDIVRDFSRMYLDRQVKIVEEYVLKLNYYLLVELIEKKSMEILLGVDISKIKEVVEYEKNAIKRNEDIKNLREAYDLL
ncbi:hypothetical protein P3W45_001048 [Vairimorpha bombi]|jgi:GTPase SAR1 family protein